MAPRIDRIVAQSQPRAVVLLLHGGQESSFAAVRNWHASWWRTAWLGWTLRGWARRNQLAVTLLQNRYRGWNDEAADGEPSAVADARWALDQIGDQYGSNPVILVGHSMGGRAACRCADHDLVSGVVALAPWLPAGEPIEPVIGTTLDVLHGTADRWTSPKLSREFVARLVARSQAATWQPLPGAGHFMFRRISMWREFVTSSVDNQLAKAENNDKEIAQNKPSHTDGGAIGSGSGTLKQGE